MVVCKHLVKHNKKETFFQPTKKLLVFNKTCASLLYICIHIIHTITPCISSFLFYHLFCFTIFLFLFLLSSFCLLCFVIIQMKYHLFEFDIMSSVCCTFSFFIYMYHLFVLHLFAVFTMIFSSSNNKKKCMIHIIFLFLSFFFVPFVFVFV